MIERVRYLRRRLSDVKPSVDINRARLVTLCYRECVGEPIVSLRGKMMYSLFTQLPINIGDDELIAGGSTVVPRAALLFPEVQGGWLDQELDTVSTREFDPLAISKEDIKELREEILPFWKGKTIYDRVYNFCPEDTKQVIFYDPNVFPTKSSALIDNFSLIHKGIGTVVPNYESILRLGVKGIISNIRSSMNLLDPTNPDDVPKFAFYNSAITTLDGFVAFSKRYAELANQMAKSEVSARRKGELRKIAEICSWVPYNPPRDFWEAIQSFWFTHLAVRLEASGHSLSPGRFDQYMFPFYKKDPSAKKSESALELIECLFVKFSELMLFASTDTSKFYTGVPQWQNLNLGGRSGDGRDVTNELSYICLQAMAETRLVQPDISVRIHQDTPESFLIKACELAKLGTGHPKFYNEDLIALSMACKGIPIDEARKFSIMGCVEPRVTCKEGSHLTGGFINLPAAVELVLTNGVWRLTGKKVGLSTGDPNKFKSFDDVIKAYEGQLAHLIRHMFVVNAIAENAYSDLISTPFLSSITEGCIEKGKDLQHGGAIYNFGPSVNAIGIADTADSLYGIKKCIFDDKLISMDELVKAIQNNFDGFEGLRNTLCFDVPKFGNDIEEVDKIAHDVVQFFNQECMKYKNLFGGTAQGGIIPVTAGIPFGKVVGALPSGRRSGEPYADGSSPSAGNDRGGPTAVLRSVARLDLARLRNGDLLNMRLTPMALNSSDAMKKFASFIRGFCDVGGWHIQFNIVDTKVLLDAQQNPERYSDLLVRVAGYSAYFTQLHKEVQDDIIRRTEHCL